MLNRKNQQKAYTILPARNESAVKVFVSKHEIATKSLIFCQEKKCNKKAVATKITFFYTNLICYMSREQTPDGWGLGGLEFQSVLWIITDVVTVFLWTFLTLPGTESKNDPWLLYLTWKPWTLFETQTFSIWINKNFRKKWHSSKTTESSLTKKMSRTSTLKWDLV